MSLRGRPRRRGGGHRCAAAARACNRDAVNNIRNRNVNPLARNTIHDERLIEIFSVGSLNEICGHCQARHFQNEMVNGHFNSCCHNGLVYFPQPHINDTLKDLMINDNHFMNNIREYNSAMSFASFSANRSHIPGIGPYCFKIQGQIHSYYR